MNFHFAGDLVACWPRTILHESNHGSESLTKGGLEAEMESSGNSWKLEREIRSGIPTPSAKHK